MGQHKVTVMVEINGGEMVLSQSQEYSGGNPLFHASEFFRNVVHPIRKIRTALKAIYGDQKTDAPTPVKTRNIEQAIEEAQEKGAAVFRYVLMVDGMEFIGEALYRVKFLNEWESMTNRPELSEVQFGLRTADKFVYKWVTL